MAHSEEFLLLFPEDRVQFLAPISSNYLLTPPPRVPVPSSGPHDHPHTYTQMQSESHNTYT